MILGLPRCTGEVAVGAVRNILEVVVPNEQPQQRCSPMDDLDTCPSAL